MALAFGHGSNILFEWESAYGTNPAGTAWKRLPCVSFDPGIAQPWERLDIVGLTGGRDEADPLRVLLTIEPTAEVPVDLINFGYWLRLLFGAPSTSGSTNFTHVYKSGGTSPSSMSVEHGNSQITGDGYQTILGVRGSTLELAFRPGEALQTATIGMTGLTASRSNASNDASPTDATFTLFTGAVMTATRGGSNLGRVTGATLRFSNGNENIREANRSSAAITESAPGVTEVTGTVDIRMDADTLLDDGESASSVALAFGYDLGSNRSLTFKVPEAYVNRVGMPVRGRAGIQATFNFRGAYNASDACSLMATLVNQTSSYA